MGSWITRTFFLSLVFLTSGFLASAANLQTKVVAVAPTVTLTQGDYRWYDNINALTPTGPLAAEDTALTTPASGSVLRLRINILDTGVQLPAGTVVKLQYANSTSGPWTDLATSTAWIFFDNPSVADGQIIATAIISNSDIGESYGESNPSAASPNPILPGQRGEWDWVIQNNSASQQSSWFFRLIYSSGTQLDFYNAYPALSASAAPPPAPTPIAPSPVVGVGGGTGYFAASSTSPASSASSVAQLPIPPPLLPPFLQRADFNGDNHVDMIDLSIVLYHYGERGSNLSYDLDGDGTIDLQDISILMYYWTE